MSIQGKAWIEIGAASDVPLRGARIVKAGARCIAVFRTAADEYYALEDSCPHKQGPLSQGIVHDRSVTCPLHNWVIDLSTGSALGADEGHVTTIPLRIENGRLFIDITMLAHSEAA
ncbi:MAG: nitrite reductase small subunit NirD [Beijerinckiaceae bacterium]